ncbi:hypothetical protein ACFW04_013053 [Cataglyphis niger]
MMYFFFRKPKHRNWTWMSPNEIDYVLTVQKDIIKDVSILNRFDTGNDHRLVKAKIVINMKQ